MLVVLGRRAGPGAARRGARAAGRLMRRWTTVRSASCVVEPEHDGMRLDNS